MKSILDNALSDNLLQAHLDFFLEKLGTNGIQSLLEDEVKQAFSSGKNTRLNQVVDREKMTRFVQSVIQKLPENEKQVSFLKKYTHTVLHSAAFDQLSLDQMVTKDSFDQAASHISKYDKLRKDIVRLVLETPIYSDLISDLLYQGIKDYIMKENIVAKKLPGISALMKAGAQGLNRAIPKLEGAAEVAIKKTISDNLNNSVQLSEKILNNALSENKIKTIADHLWHKLSEEKFSKLKLYFEDQLEEGTDQAGSSLLESICQSDMMDSLVSEWGEAVFDAVGDKPLTKVLQEWGVGEAFILEHLPGLVSGIKVSDGVKQYIKERAQSHLYEFYQSDAFRLAVNKSG